MEGLFILSSFFFTSLVYSSLFFSPLSHSPSQLLFTLTFWLLLRQSVKDSFSRTNTAPLQEVTTGGVYHTHTHMSSSKHIE